MCKHYFSELCFVLYLESHPENGEPFAYGEAGKCAAFFHRTAVGLPRCSPGILNLANLQ
jgi:hypothetical protein